MTITPVASTGISTTTGNLGSTTTVIPYVGVPTAGEVRRAYIAATAKDGDATDFVSCVDDAANAWALLVDVPGGENPHPNPGANDNGRVRLGVWWRDLDGTETGNVTITATGSLSLTGAMSVYESSAGAWADPAVVTGDATPHAQNRSVTAGAWAEALAAGDVAYIAHAIDSDNAGALTALTITQPGATFDAVVLRNRTLNGNGSDTSIVTADAAVTAGAGGSPTVAFSGPGVSASCGAAAVVRLRESSDLTVSGAGGIESGEAFGAAAVEVGPAAVVDVDGGGIETGEAFGAAAVEVGPAAVVDVDGGGIAGAVTFGTFTITLEVPGVIVGAGGIGSGEAFGAPTVVLGGAVVADAGGIPSGEAFGVPFVESGTFTGCEDWPVDTRLCLPAGWNTDPAQWTVTQMLARQTAEQILRGLTAGVYGLCFETVRPCRPACAMEYGYLLQPGSTTWYAPMLWGGQVYNTCAAGCYDGCRCGASLAQIQLPGEVYDVARIIVDGAVLPSTAYRVDEGGWLVRTDGDLWPTHQNLNLPESAVGTWAVTYRRGVPLPVAGQRALMIFTAEIAKSCVGDPSCRLPARIEQVVRDGVTYLLQTDYQATLDAGRTGVAEVDMWLATINPHGIREQMRVYSPDVTRFRRTR